MDVIIKEIGQNRGIPRVWLQGQMLSRAGFTPGSTYRIKTEGGIVVLTKDKDGLTLVSDDFSLSSESEQSDKIRKVSQKSMNQRTVPVVDINSREWLSLFQGLSHVRVVLKEGLIRILPLASELRAKERIETAKKNVRTGQAISTGSLAHGGGVMDHAVHTGMHQVGLKAKLGFANDIDETMIEQSMTHNSVWSADSFGVCGKMQEVAFDEWLMRNMPQVSVLCAGIPCSGASTAGRAKRGLSFPEQHPEVGHLVVPFLAIVARANPLVVCLENVPSYASSPSAAIIRSMLRDLNYTVHETEVDGADWNALEHRKRWVMVAVTNGMSFNFDDLKKPEKKARKLGEILEDIPLDDERWSRMEGLKAKEIRDREAGKSFAMQIFDAESEKICTLTRGLQRNRSTDAKIRHPVDPDLLRLPTPCEHASAKQIPSKLIEGLCSTTAHELMGQSVCYSPFVAIGELIAKSIQDLCDAENYTAPIKAELQAA